MNRRVTPSSACVWLGVVVALTLTGSVRPVSAAEIRMLGAGPLRAALVALAERFQKETGHVVKIETLPGAEVTRILASDEPADIFMNNNLATVDRLIADGKAADSKTLVGRTGIGVMVRSGAPVPIVATAADIKAAVLAADAVAYNTAPSGQYVEKLFEQMGVAEKIKDKSVRPPNGATTMERVAGGKGAEIGFGLRNEMTPYLDKGLQFVAMLPDDLQNYTRYEAVVLSRSKAPDAARAFLRYVTSAAARSEFAKIGVVD
jgi:molybdate transport system substrate-binding protein